MIVAPADLNAVALVVLIPLLLFALAVAINSRMLLVLSLIVTIVMVGTWALTGINIVRVKLPECLLCSITPASIQSHIREGPPWPFVVL